MNSHELNIANSIMEDVLKKLEVEELKHRLTNAENYSAFLDKLVAILIGKDISLSLFEFLELNSLSDRLLSIQNKRINLIEGLADLYFKGHSSENILFLIESHNDIFITHLQFLKDTQAAIIFKERGELKKKFEKLDKLKEFNLTDDEIKAAIIFSERQSLKTRLRELENKKKIEHAVNEIDVGAPLKIAALKTQIRPSSIKESNFQEKESKIISINFKTLLKYAAIIVLIIGPAIFTIQRYNHNTKDNTEDLADNKKINNVDTASNKNVLPTFKIPVAHTYSFENNILESKSLGFSQKEVKKIKITIVDIVIQILNLEEMCQSEAYRRRGSDGQKSCFVMLDSIKAMRETYVYYDNRKELVLYSKRVFDDSKLISIELNKKKKIYLKSSNKYYFINQIETSNVLKEETNEDVIDQLNVIENQND